MGAKKVQRGIVGRQYGVIARWQLLERGYTERSIKHNIETKWLYPIFAGVYAVGRPEVSRFGMWMAAVLASGLSAVVSHDSAAALWGIWSYTPDLIVSVPAHCRPRNPGIRVHRRAHIDATTHHGIPVTTPTATLIDFAATHPRNEVEAALNEADLRGSSSSVPCARNSRRCPACRVSPSSRPRSTGAPSRTRAPISNAPSSRSPGARACRSRSRACT